MQGKGVSNFKTKWRLFFLKKRKDLKSAHDDFAELGIMSILQTSQNQKSSSICKFRRWFREVHEKELLRCIENTIGLCLLMKDYNIQLFPCAVVIPE